MPPNFQALLFDLDGTLVDSSAVVRRIMEAWCLKHGIPLQPVLDICFGGRTEDTVALVAPHLDAKSEAAQLDSLEGATMDGLVAIEGAAAFLASLGTHEWAVVTSSSILTAEPKLKACNLAIPRVVITAESVENGKPHPDPFIKAAQLLGIAPQDCLVFEDTDNGVRSALAAGCKVVIVGKDCRIQDGNVIARIASFAEIQPTESGDMRVGGRTIATLTRR